jgi:hypothetical protein
MPVIFRVREPPALSNRLAFHQGRPMFASLHGLDPWEFVHVQPDFRSWFSVRSARALEYLLQTVLAVRIRLLQVVLLLIQVRHLLGQRLALSL